MKKLFLIATVIFSQNSAYAWDFEAKAECNINMGQNVVCTAYNTMPGPIFCQLVAQGMSASGSWASEWSNQLLFPGRFMQVSVYANNPLYDPMIRADSKFLCDYRY